jgi:3-dehydroquinate synthetase
MPKSLDPYDVMAKMTLDKKNAASVVRTVILQSIGDVLPSPVGS